MILYSSYQTLKHEHRADEQRGGGISKIKQDFYPEHYEMLLVEKLCFTTKKLYERKYMF